MEKRRPSVRHIQIRLSVFEVKYRSHSTMAEGRGRYTAGRGRFLLEAPVQTSGLGQLGRRWRSCYCQASGGRYPGKVS